MVARGAATLLVAATLVMGLAGCGSQEKDFKKQLEQAGMSVSDVRKESEKKKTTKTSTKRPKKSTNKTLYEADVKFGANGQCLVEFEQGKGEKRYYLDEVNNAEPAVSLMKDNPTKADVEAYLRGPDSPCKI